MEIEVEREGVTTEMMKVVYSCDLCGKISRHRRTCSICNRNTCSSCTFFDPRCTRDYRDMYCESCFDIGEKYFKRMEEEQKKFDDLMEEIEKEWKDHAINAANSTRNKTE